MSPIHSSVVAKYRSTPCTAHVAFYYQLASTIGGEVCNLPLLPKSFGARELLLVENVGIKLFIQYVRLLNIEVASSGGGC